MSGPHFNFATNGCLFPAAPELASRAYQMPPRVAATLRRWAAHRRQRRALSELDDRLLRDIGLTRDAATREGRKPFWR